MFGSIRYFLAADYQLQKETGQIQLTSIQARLLQCYYLLSRSRINQCWSIFGVVVNLSIALGIHRKQGHEFSGETDFVHLECRKRAFWSAYILDKYLSAALGRPQMFHDEDVDQAGRFIFIRTISSLAIQILRNVGSSRIRCCQQQSLTAIFKLLPFQILVASSIQ